jgi:hypothetical protein
VEGLACGREERYDVLPVVCKLDEPMREGEHCCSDGSVPSDSPVSSIGNSFRGLNHSARDLDVAKLLSFDFIICGRELSTEHGIEIDSSTCNNVLPLCIREFRTIWWVCERSSHGFGVDTEELKQFKGSGEVLQ